MVAVWLPSFAALFTVPRLPVPLPLHTHTLIYITRVPGLLLLDLRLTLITFTLVPQLFTLLFSLPRWLQF